MFHPIIDCNKSEAYCPTLRRGERDVCFECCNWLVTCITSWCSVHDTIYNSVCSMFIYNVCMFYNLFVCECLYATKPEFQSNAPNSEPCTTCWVIHIPPFPTNILSHSYEQGGVPPHLALGPQQFCLFII